MRETRRTDHEEAKTMFETSEVELKHKMENGMAASRSPEHRGTRTREKEGTENGRERLEARAVRSRPDVTSSRFATARFEHSFLVQYRPREPIVTRSSGRPSLLFFLISAKTFRFLLELDSFTRNFTIRLLWNTSNKVNVIFKRNAKRCKFCEGAKDACNALKRHGRSQADLGRWRHSRFCIRCSIDRFRLS